MDTLSGWSRVGIAAQLARRSGIGILPWHVHPNAPQCPLLVGGAVAWFVSTRSKDKAINDARRDRGTLISSGLIAGGALFGVFAALTRFAEFEYNNTMSTALTQGLGVAVYAMLIIYLAYDSMRVKKQ